MNIINDFQETPRTQEALTNFGKQIIAEILKNAEGFGVGVGFNDEAKWVQIQKAGWAFTIAYLDKQQVLSSNLQLNISPDGLSKSIDIYNAALELYPLIIEIQKLSEQTMKSVASVDSVKVKKSKKSKKKTEK